MDWFGTITRVAENNDFIRARKATGESGTRVSENKREKAAASGRFCLQEEDDTAHAGILSPSLESLLPLRVAKEERPPSLLALLPWPEETPRRTLFCCRFWF